MGFEALDGGKPLFLVGSDGTTSFNEKGVIPRAEADAFSTAFTVNTPVAPTLFKPPG